MHRVLDRCQEFVRHCWLVQQCNITLQLGRRSIASMTRIRRAAAAVIVATLCAVAGRADSREPAEQFAPGALVICGGGELPPRVLDRFVALAGGDAARIVVIPTASESADSADPAESIAPWRMRGAADVVVLHTRSRDEANDVRFIEPLRQATGVWFGGGDQSRIADAYLDTAVERELYSLLNRGGAIGGTSAGAAIQSRVMIAGGDQTAQLATGFDLLPGAVVDQHFLRRSRVNRLLGVVAERPGLTGIGIDEATALVVQDGQCEVLGESYVVVATRGAPDAPWNIVSRSAGDRFPAPRR